MMVSFIQPSHKVQNAAADSLPKPSHPDFAPDKIKNRIFRMDFCPQSRHKASNVLRGSFLIVQHQDYSPNSSSH